MYFNIAVHICTDRKLTDSIYSSQAPVGDRQYTSILFISSKFLPTILNYLNDREGAPISFVGFWDSPSAIHPSPDTTILNYLNDRERGRHYLL